ncbi:cell wall-binding repeat-containing protein [Euzebya sp.]|uniref:cell wall-binding repeat-containing protein n=1 Tax=Euzebya sp. TaxID=1971409 RepID=UPI0035162B55
MAVRPPVRRRRGALALAALVLSLLVVPVLPAAAQPDGANVSIIKDNEAPSNAEIAARLSEETLSTSQRVVISRDDDFADALASGILQADSPLLLVPRNGPVPPRVLGEIQRLGATGAVILGGTGAVAPAVAEQLADAGLSVERRQGGSRIETAIDIARTEAPDATTAILARAFAADPANPTQAFADALGAGAMSAENGWPILLSSTEALTAATRDYLADSDIDEIQLVGGTAALSEAVEAEIRDMGITTTRIAGDSRAETALEIAKAQGADSAADIDHVVLVDGTSPDGWAGGFASAARAAALDAPIVLADGVRLPPQTEAFLAEGTSFAQDGDLTITCVTHPLACTEGRRALGLSDYPVLTLEPPRGVLVQPGQQVRLTLSPASEGADVEILTEGTCLGESQLVQTDSSGHATVTFASELPPLTCLLTITYTGVEGDAFLRSTVAYVTEGQPARTADQAFIASDVLAFGSVVPDQPVFVNDTVTCTPPGGTPTSRSAWAMQAQHQQDGAPGYDFVNVGSEPLVTSPDASCEIQITPPPQATRVFWGLYTFTDSSLRVPLALGTGTTARFDLAQIAAQTGVDTRDLSVRWVVQIDDPAPTAPQPPPPGVAGVLNNPDGIPVTCGGQVFGPGVHLVGPDVRCSAAIDHPAFHVLLVQPDRPNVSAPSVEFTTLADTRFTTVRAQLLYEPPPVGEDGGACDTAAPLQLGVQDAGAVTEPEELRFHVIDLDAGESVRIRADAAFGDFDPIIAVAGPDGRILAENDDESLPSGERAGVGSRIDLTAEDSGTHCIAVSGFGGSIGDYLIAVDPAPVFADEGTFDEEFPAFGLTVDGTAGDVVIIELRRRTEFDGTDPVLDVYDPQGTLVATDDDGGGFPNARITYTLPTTGVYEVVGATYDEFTLGPFTIEASVIEVDGGASAFAGLTPAG